MNHLAPPHSTPSPPTSISPTTLSRSYFSRPSSHSSHIPSSKPNHRQRDPSHLTIGRLQPRSTHNQNHTHILSARTARELEIIRSTSQTLPPHWQPPQSLKVDLGQDHSWSCQLGQTRPRHARGNSLTESRVRKESGEKGVEYRIYETVTFFRTQPQSGTSRVREEMQTFVPSKTSMISLPSLSSLNPMRRSSLPLLAPLFKSAKLLSPGIFGRPSDSRLGTPIVLVREGQDACELEKAGRMESLVEVCKRRGKSIAALRIV